MNQLRSPRMVKALSHIFAAAGLSKELFESVMLLPPTQISTTFGQENDAIHISVGEQAYERAYDLLSGMAQHVFRQAAPERYEFVISLLRDEEIMRSSSYQNGAVEALRQGTSGG